MSEQKKRLRRALNNIPLDNEERRVTEADIENMSDEEAEDIAKNLEAAFAALPDALDELDKELDKSRKRRGL